jgi:hypothetical protein
MIQHMSTTKTSHVRRAIARVKKVWAELDYANRRALEIRTGIPFRTPEERSRSLARVRALEYLYASEDAQVSAR